MSNMSLFLHASVEIRLCPTIHHSCALLALVHNSHSARPSHNSHLASASYRYCRSTSPSPLYASPSISATASDSDLPRRHCFLCPFDSRLRSARPLCCRVVHGRSRRNRTAARRSLQVSSPSGFRAPGLNRRRSSSSATPPVTTSTAACIDVGRSGAMMPASALAEMRPSDETQQLLLSIEAAESRVGGGIFSRSASTPIRTISATRIGRRRCR